MNINGDPKPIAHLENQEKSSKDGQNVKNEQAVKIGDVAGKTLSSQQAAVEKDQSEKKDTEQSLRIQKAVKEIEASLLKEKESKATPALLRQHFQKIAAGHFKHFSSEECTIEFAKTLVNNLTKEFPHCATWMIYDFGLNEDDKYEIAKAATRKNPFFPWRYNLLNIQPLARQIEILKIAGEQDPKALFELDRSTCDLNYGDLVEIVLDVARKKPREIAKSTFTSTFVFDSLEDKHRFCKILAKHDPYALFLYTCCGTIGSLLAERSTHPKELVELESEIFDSTNHQLINWLGAYQILAREERLSDQNHETLVPYIRAILKGGNFFERGPALGAALFAGKHFFKKGAPNPLRSEIFLNAFHAQSKLSAADLQAVDARIRSRMFTKGRENQSILETGLYLLWTNEKLQIQEKDLLLKHIFTVKNEKETLSRLIMCTCILSTEGEELLRKAIRRSLEVDIKANNAEVIKKAVEDDKSLNLSDILQQMFTNSFQFESHITFKHLFNDILGKARKPEALLIYGSNLQQLPEEERSSVLRICRLFITELQNGSYKKWRYQTPTSSHLEQVFANQLELQTAWQAGSPPEGISKFSAAADPLPKQDPIAKAYTEGHIKTTDFPSLTAFLKDRTQYASLMKKLGEDLKQEFANKKQAESKDKETQDKEKPLIAGKEKMTVVALQFESNLIKLLGGPKKTPAQRLSDVDPILFQAKKLLDTAHVFVKALEKLKETLQEEIKLAKTQSEVDAYTIEDTDDWEDLLLMGTEITGSCQNIAGKVDNNKCLIGTLADGKYRLIAVKGKDGQLVSRCLIRLLWDPAAKVPVLYQEKVYQNPGVPEEVGNAMRLLLERRAKDLGVALVSASDPQGTPEAARRRAYPNPLQSLGSPAPFEYVDAEGNKVTEGVYTISNQSINYGCNLNSD